MSIPDPSRWQRIAAIVDEVLDLEPVPRATCLDAQCDGDPTLRAEVERVLAEADSATYLDSPALAFAAPLLADRVTRSGSEPAAPGGPGALIGPYRVLEEIAHGGMGVVYLAERADGQFEQRVALKLVRRGMDSDDIARRFLAERQILARLAHPHIARLLDGGVSADGQPYFAMEYVPGVPITQYCDERRLGVADRLRLFHDVCEAVRYAHHNLVVHRDLKPSNVLVTADGEVKLLDFGIAKVLSSQEELDPAATQTGLRVMTPTYAAPEQVRGGGITTATDVYALGLVLYELLTGRLAHRFERQTPAEYERVVCETEPEPPSAAVAQPIPAIRGEGSRTVLAPAAIAEARGTLPQRLRRDLRGDLDTIVLKALQKEPVRRYASAEALLEDLERHRTGLPVQARPDSATYRATKFLRRHRLGVAAAAGILVALLTGLVGTIWQARTARRQAAKATAVQDFLVSLFTVSDPAQSRGQQLTARELLDRGVRRADSALAGQPAVQADLLHILGHIYSQLGLFDHADSLVRRALALSSEVTGPRSVEVEDELNSLGSVLWSKSKYAAAESALTQALQIARVRLGADDPGVATVLVNLAAVVADRGDLGRAEPLLREAIAIDRQRLGDSAAGLATDLSNLGLLLRDLGKLAGADSALRNAVAIDRGQLPPDHPQLLIALHNLANLRNHQGDFKEAERLEREVLEARRRVFPQGHPDLAHSAHQLAGILENQGRYAEAESLLVSALAIRRQWLGPDHDLTLRTVNSLAVLSYRIGDLATAERYGREAYTGWMRSLGDEHPHTATALGVLGAILSEEGRFAEAEPLLETAASRQRHILGDSGVDLAVTLASLGAHYRRVLRYADGERALRQALAIDRARLPPGHINTAATLSGLGALLTDAGRPAEAEPLLREALAIQIDKHGATDQRTAESQRRLGICLGAVGRYGEAEQLFLASEQSLRAANPASFRYPETLRSLVLFYEARHRPADAARFRRLLTPPPPAPAPSGGPHPGTVSGLRGRGRVLYRTTHRRDLCAKTCPSSVWGSCSPRAAGAPILRGRVTVAPRAAANVRFSLEPTSRPSRARWSRRCRGGRARAPAAPARTTPRPMVTRISA
jgi:serine/threonine protein kinase